jgi:hypothetical protein
LSSLLAILFVRLSLDLPDRSGEPVQLHGWHGRAGLWATAILIGGASWLALGGAVPSETASTSRASNEVAHLAAAVTYNPGAFVAIAATESGGGYWLAQAGGGIYSFGDAHFYGSLPQTGVSPAAPVVGMAAPDGGGYWLVGSDGGIFAFGDAPFYGSTSNLRLNQPIVGMAATPDGHGYWLVASDGGVFAFGDALFYGSAESLHLNKPIVGITAEGTGLGYWLVAADGGIFNFGDAQFRGSTGNLQLNQPMVGIGFAPHTGGGSPRPGQQYMSYWLVAADGGIFTFGNAIFYGSTGSLHLNRPIVGMAATPDGNGYWLMGSDGGVFSFGDAGFHGSATGPPPACVGSQFAAAVTTSGSSFAKGQTIPITLSITNVGQPCESFAGGGNADVLDGCPSVVAINASGQSVWNSMANPYGAGCAAPGIEGAIPSGWSQTYPFSWNQLECPVSGSGCTQIQAPPGTYTIAFGGAELGETWVGVTVKPAVVSID